MQEDITEKVDAFFEQYRLKQYHKGQILILSGDDTDYIYRLVSGTVKQYDVTYRGDEIILNIFKPPSFFPMSLAINKTPNPYVFEAESDIEVRQAPAAEVVKFVKENPDVLFDLLSRVYRGTDGLIGRLAHLMGSNAKGRLMYEILIACRRFGETRKDGSCIIRLSEKDLASRVGITRETISREMSKLAREKLLEIKTGMIIVKDIDAFEAKLGTTL